MSKRQPTAPSITNTYEQSLKKKQQLQWACFEVLIERMATEPQIKDKIRTGGVYYKNSIYHITNE